MTTEPGREVFQAAVSKSGIWVCTTQTSLSNVVVSLRSNFIQRLKADLGDPETGGLDWPNTTGIIRPDYALGAGPSIELAPIAQTVRCSTKPRYRGTQPFR
jgi:hypothetical protein